MLHLVYDLVSLITIYYACLRVTLAVMDQIPIIRSTLCNCSYHIAEYGEREESPCDETLSLTALDHRTS